MKKKPPVLKQFDEISQQARERIYALVMNHAKKNPNSPWSGKYLVELERSIKAFYKDMGMKYQGAFRDTLPDMMKSYYDAAAEEIKTAGVYKAIKGEPDPQRVKYFLESSFDQVAMKTDKMSFEHIKQLRNISADVIREMSITGNTRREVSKMMIDRALKIKGFEFTDNAGKKWSNRSYFNMLARTELMNAARASYDDKMAEEGFDVMKLSTSGKSCDSCAKYEGKLFSLTGATAGIPSKADLEADGVFHPNCTHSYSLVPPSMLPEDLRNAIKQQEQDENKAVAIILQKAKTEKDNIPREKPFVFPDDPTKLTVVKTLGGSTGAQLVKDENGNLFVRKTGGAAGGDAAAHLRNECAADTFYQKCGVNVPEHRLYETANGPVKLSRYIDGGKSLNDFWASASDAERQEMLKKLRSGFDVDVLTGNWDVVGMSGDNILIDKNGVPWRIDNGGALGFRAQGAPKRSEDWQAGFPDDIWSMRTSSNNKRYFENINTLDLCNTISKRNFADALKSLPDADRKIIEKRLAEIKQLADRGNDFKLSGYTDKSIETVLKSSYELCKNGLREYVPQQLTLGADHLPKDYGWFRTKRGGIDDSDSVTAQNENIQKKILAGVKTWATHNKEGGDFQPNMTTISDMVDLKPELEKLAKQGNVNAEYYLQQIEKIENAVKNKSPFDGVTIDNKKDVYVANLNVAMKPGSFTSMMADYINAQEVEIHGAKEKLNFDFIPKWQSAQGSDSYDKSNPDLDACKLKIARLNALGITNLKDAKQRFYIGVNNNYHQKNIKAAFQYYQNNPDELERDTQTFLRYQAGIVVALENCAFPGNDIANHSVLLMRSENANIIGNSQIGSEWQAQKGINESHSIFRQTYIFGTELTITRVPYSRISGMFFAERYPGNNNCCFLSDGENEFNADTSGLKTLYIGTRPTGKAKDFHDQFLKWEQNGYK